MTAQPPKSDHPCGICGATPAPYGFRLPGPIRDLPDRRRGYLWACALHRAEAEDRHARATHNPANRQAVTPG